MDAWKVEKLTIGQLIDIFYHLYGQIIIKKNSHNTG